MQIIPHADEAVEQMIPAIVTAPPAHIEMNGKNVFHVSVTIDNSGMSEIIGAYPALILHYSRLRVASAPL